ncbi:MAG: LytTR family DNA-binding domain-containing protein, partial [Bacteroidota bacterium]
YISIVTDSEKIMLLGSLVHWEKKLAEFSFDRIHRSYIVNRDRVDKVRGQSVVVGTTELPLGGVYRKSFLQQYR